MSRKLNGILMLFIAILSSVCGNSSKSIKDKLFEISNHWNMDRTHVSNLLNVLFNGRISTLENGRSYNTKVLIAMCKHEKGIERKLCVASYVRKLFPNIFRQRTQIARRHHMANHSNMTMEAAFPFSVTASPADISTTCEPSTKLMKKKFVSNSNDVKGGDNIHTSAVLIVPGAKKKVTHILQDTKANVQRVNDVAVKPITCRKEEFGFADDVDPKIVAIASEMLCSLCQDQGDGLCIVRWCIKF